MLSGYFCEEKKEVEDHEPRDLPRVGAAAACRCVGKNIEKLGCEK